MKKVITICLALCCLFSLFATTYTLDTKYGTKTLEIPEGYTELEVLKVIATEYYNLDGDYKLLEEKANKLIKDSENYVKEVELYKKDLSMLMNNYNKLNDLYSKQNKVSLIRGSIGASVQFSKLKFTSAGISIGAFLVNKALVSMDINYPLSITYRVNWVF